MSYINIDSFVLEIKTDDVCKDLKTHSNDAMDFNDCPKDHLCFYIATKK